MKSSPVVFLVFASFVSSTLLHAQDALSTIRQSFTSSLAQYRVNVDGILASKDLLGRPSEVRIINGAVNRSFIQAHNNQNILIPEGTLVKIREVAAPENQKNDILRVTVEAHGFMVPLAFVLSKGSLAAMNESQLRELVGRILAPVQAQTPAIRTSAMGSEQRITVPDRAAESIRLPLDVPSVTELNEILKRHQGEALVKPENVRGAMASPDNTPDNMIVDGVFRPQQRGMHNGMRDVYLWPNSAVQFMSLSAFADDRQDLLHLVVRAASGAFAPFTWEFPKGQLASMSKANIMHAVDSIVVFAAADENTFRNEPRANHSGAPGAPSSSSSLTFHGLSLGMTKAEVAVLAMKNGGFTHPEDTSDTIVWFKDAVFEYNVEFGSGARVKGYNVYPLDHNAHLVGLRRGSLYQAAVQALGPPAKTSSADNSLTWIGLAGAKAQYSYTPTELWPAGLNISMQ